MGALCSHLPAAGMYISTELWIHSSPALPPTANKQSPRAATPALDLGTPIAATHDHLPSRGSYASTLASLVRVLVMPPATYSRPASRHMHSFLTTNYTPDPSSLAGRPFCSHACVVPQHQVHGIKVTTYDCSFT